MIKQLTLSDLEKRINYAVANNVTTHFTVLGDLCSDLVDYIEYEHNLKQWTDEYEEPLYDFESNVVYTLTIYDGEYYVQEAYYQHDEGEILASYGDKDEIAYVEVDTELTTSDIKRILCGKIVLFKLDNELSYEDEEDNNKHLYPNKQNNKCNKCVSKTTYKVNGKQVSKDEYDKVSKEFDNSIESLIDDIRNTFNFFKIRY